MSDETLKARDITQGHKALFELLYLTWSWLEKHGYFPMDAKFALLWVYSLIERASDESGWRAARSPDSTAAAPSASGRSPGGDATLMSMSALIPRAPHQAGAVAGLGSRTPGAQGEVAHRATHGRACPAGR